jgi:hypothetical protein
MGGKLLCTTDGSVITLLMPNGRKLASTLSLFQPVGLIITATFLTNAEKKI